MVKQKSLSILGLILGSAIVIAASIIGWVILPYVVEQRIKDATRLTNPETLRLWTDPEASTLLKIYVYNYTNPKNLLKGKRLTVKQLGPYIFKQTRHKNVSISLDKITATYKEKVYYFFDENASKGQLTDVVNVPNAPFISIAHAGFATAGDENMDGVKLLVDLMASDEEIIKTDVPVKNLLFEGWEIQKLAFNLIPEDKVPPDLKGGKFGMYNNKNGSYQDEWVVLTGDKNPNELGKILSWNGFKQLNWWYSPRLNKNSSDHYCNRINGSDGSLFPPFITKETHLRMFNPDACRSLHMVFDHETKFKDIPAFKFKFPSSELAAPICNPGNRCFCQRQSKDLAHQCWQQTQRLYSCKQGAPIVLSKARFLDGNDELFEGITIKPPVRELHDSFLEIEPQTGILLQASIKMQINIELQKLEKFEAFKDLSFANYTDSSSILLPIIWVEQQAQLDDRTVKMIHDKFIRTTEKIKISKWVALLSGGIITFASAVCLIASLKRDD